MRHHRSFQFSSTLGITLLRICVFGLVIPALFSFSFIVLYRAGRPDESSTSSSQPRRQHDSHTCKAFKRSHHRIEEASLGLLKYFECISCAKVSTEKEKLRVFKNSTLTISTLESSSARSTKGVMKNKLPIDGRQSHRV